MNRRAIAIAALALLGLADSLYLLTVHWGWWQAVCLGIGSCEVVNASVYSELLGVPVALLGALAYLAILAASLLILREAYGELARRAVFFVALVGVVFSAYLTVVELFILHEICPWCVLSALLITLIAVLGGWELRQWESDGFESAV
ncbi:MAG: vitamin K epoxide reductase family protein [Chloroflexi bacterium]|nr:vitamin K epoxide reductase family protein [Chloroflexota bacterium]